MRAERKDSLVVGGITPGACVGLRLGRCWSGYFYFIAECERSIVENVGNKMQTGKVFSRKDKKDAHTRTCEVVH